MIERFLEVVKKLGLTIYQLNKNLDGIPMGTLYNLKSGRTKTLTDRLLNSLCEKYPQVNREYIRTGEGEMFNDGTVIADGIRKDVSAITRRFIEALEEVGESDYRIAETIGINRSYLSRLRNGKRTVSVKVVNTLCGEYGYLNKEYILTGVGSLSTKSSSLLFPSILKAVKPIPETTCEVRFIGSRATATFVEKLYDMQDDNEFDTYPVVPRHGEDLKSNKYAVFEVDGDSMVPTISNHAKVLAEQVDEGKWEYASGVAVVVYAKSMVIKRIKNNMLFSDNSVTLASDNAKFGEFTVQRKDIRAIYHVIRKVDEDIF